MSIVRTALVAAAIVAPALAAHAATPRLTDVQYIAASRCIGLMESKALGPVDDYALKARLISERDSVCVALMPPTQTTAAPNTTHAE